jgi:hypothetical protein
MGSYYTLYVGNVKLWDGGSYVGNDATSLFCKADRVQIPLHSTMRAIFHQEWLQKRGETESPEEVDRYLNRQAYLYRCTVGEAIDRLDVRGFTLVAAREQFKMAVAEHRQWYPRHGPSGVIPRGFNFAAWSGAVREVIVRNARSPPWSAEDHEAFEGVPLLAASPLSLGANRLLFCPHDEDADIRASLRALLEQFDRETVIELDYTDLVEGGYHGEDEELCAQNGKHIVLTEGPSDVQLLQPALRLLYPHLSDIFHFMDFGGTGFSGGVGALGNAVRAFVGSSIENPIIALFDNDTAGREVLAALGKVAMPPNIRLIPLPPLKMARRYPTLGPEGIRKLDINGRACSLELYFGRDVLVQEDGTLTPVQWTGYVKSMKQYQGEILDKNRLQDRFREKLRRAEADPASITAMDWEGMRAIFQALFTAFK